MSKRKKDNGVIVTCLGNSKSQVTASCWSVAYPKGNGERGLIILECGLDQSCSQTPDKQYNANRKMLDNIGKGVVGAAEYLILGHAHV